MEVLSYIIYRFLKTRKVVRKGVGNSKFRSDRNCRMITQRYVVILRKLDRRYEDLKYKDIFNLSQYSGRKNSY